MFQCTVGKYVQIRYTRQVCRKLGIKSERDEHRLECLQLLHDIYQIFALSDIVPTDAEWEAVMEKVDFFLLHYNWLTKFSVSKGRTNYNLTIKFHMMWHLCWMSKYLNPRATWCYEFEDLIRQVVRCAKACVAGTPMKLVARKVMENYCLVLHLTLTGRLEKSLPA